MLPICLSGSIEPRLGRMINLAFCGPKLIYTSACLFPQVPLPVNQVSTEAGSLGNPMIMMQLSPGPGGLWVATFELLETVRRLSLTPCIHQGSLEEQIL